MLEPLIVLFWGLWLIDKVDAATRSRMMAGIKGKNTAPELLIRKILHARGFRFRIHVKDLPGKPDIVLPKYKSVILVHGCFWHGHNCRYFKVPKSRTEFWLGKISKNKSRDDAQLFALRNAGWRVLIIWECAVRKLYKLESPGLTDLIINWVTGADALSELDESSF